MVKFYSNGFVCSKPKRIGDDVWKVCCNNMVTVGKEPVEFGVGLGVLIPEGVTMEFGNLLDGEIKVLNEPVCGDGTIKDIRLTVQLDCNIDKLFLSPCDEVVTLTFR